VSIFRKEKIFGPGMQVDLHRSEKGDIIKVTKVLDGGYVMVRKAYWFDLFLYKHKRLFGQKYWWELMK